MRNRPTRRPGGLDRWAVGVAGDGSLTRRGDEDDLDLLGTSVPLQVISDSIALVNDTFHLGCDAQERRVVGGIIGVETSVPRDSVQVDTTSIVQTPMLMVGRIANRDA